MYVCAFVCMCSRHTCVYFVYLQSVLLLMQGLLMPAERSCLFLDD